MIVRMDKKIKIANELLEWLKSKIVITYPVYKSIIVPFSKERGYEYYETWAGWHLLRKFERIKGKYNNLCVADYTPIGDDASHSKITLKDITIKKVYEWTCNVCQSSGYESSIKDAKDRARLHIDANHK